MSPIKSWIVCALCECLCVYVYSFPQKTQYLCRSTALLEMMHRIQQSLNSGSFLVCWWTFLDSLGDISAQSNENRNAIKRDGAIPPACTQCPQAERLHEVLSRQSVCHFLHFLHHLPLALRQHEIKKKKKKNGTLSIKECGRYQKQKQIAFGGQLRLRKPQSSKRDW